MIETYKAPFRPGAIKTPTSSADALTGRDATGPGAVLADVVGAGTGVGEASAAGVDETETVGAGLADNEAVAGGLGLSD